MQIRRRRFLQLGVALTALPALLRGARAQAYPSGPVRIVVPYPAGGSTDFHARLVGQWLSGRLGQQFIVDNRPGAGGNIGADTVAHAPADGRTLLLVSLANAVNGTLYQKLNHNFLRDFSPVAGIIRGPYFMVVHPSYPKKTLPEFIAFAKANPAMINMASAGMGSPSHLMGELLNIMSGIKMVHIAYRGDSPALTDVISGHVQVFFVGASASLEHIKAGRLRALAVTTAARSAAAPDVPTISETISGYDASGWAGIAAPRGTPEEIIDMLNREINAALINPGIRSRYDELSLTTLIGPPADFGKFLVDETEKWGKVIRAANIKPE